MGVGHVPDGRGRGVASDVQRNPVVDRPAAGAACASMTEVVVRCDGRRCRVRLGGRTITSSNTTTPTGGFGGSAEHPCSAQKRTVARTAQKSGEYRRIRGRT